MSIYQNQQTGGYFNEGKEESDYANKDEQKMEYVNKTADDKEKDRILVGSDGSEYVLQSWLSEEIGLKVEELSGITLKQREDGKFDSFLGEELSENFMLF